MLHYRSKLYTERISEVDQQAEDRTGMKENEPEQFPKRGKRVFRSSLVILMVAVSFLGACELFDNELPPEQPLYFEYVYVNHAWGFQHHGWLIDGDGYVRYFNQPENFRTPDSLGYLSLQDLEYNLGQTDSVITHIPADEFQKYLGYIPGAAKGEIGEQENAAADAGASVLGAYLYDPDQDLYEYVFLGQSGDWEQFNLSSEAGKLVDWLTDFGVFWLSR